MGLDILLSKINNCRKDLRALHLVEQSKRNVEWQNQFSILKNNYQKFLHEIKLGKININYKINKTEIDEAYSNKLLSKLQFDNLLYNYKLSKLRDLHPVLYINKENKIYFIVQTNQSVAVKNPIADELNATSKEYISVQTISQQNYTANAIYVIEAKDVNDLSNLVENVDQHFHFKEKFINNQSELNILIKKEKAFEIFYNNFFTQNPAELSNDVLLFNEDIQIKMSVNNSELVDVTFDKYVVDNIDRISNYEKYRSESLMSYLKAYEIDDKNDPSDI